MIKYIRKKRLSSIYSKTHIFLGKCLISLYIEYTLYSSREERVIFPIKHTLQSGQNTKEKEMYRQKSVIFTIGKTLYIYIGWGKIQKKKEGFFYIYKKTPIISVSIVYI